MTSICSAHTPAGRERDWGRKIAFWFLGGALATVALILAGAAVLIASGVLGW